MKKSRFKEIVKEVLVEDNEYQVFFQKCLDKAGKSIPEMGTQEKRDFFNKIDSAWKGKGEKNEDLVGNQTKLDVDKDGDIDASDLKKLRSESKQPLNEGWFEIITQGALVLSLIAWAFQLKGYSFSGSGFKQVFKDIKKWWKTLKMDKDLVRIVTKMTQDKEIMDAAKEKVLGPRGGKKPQWQSDDKFREFLKQKLGSSDYATLKKFTETSRYDKNPNSGAWLNQNTYTSKYNNDTKRITGESKLNEGADWILLSSIHKLIDSYRGDLMPKNDPFGDEISPNEKEWKTLYKKASPKDKKTMDDIVRGTNESVNEGKFKKDDLVYNTRTKTVGIVRIGDDKYGEVKTDADGNVDVDELEIYNPIKNKHQSSAKAAPSTQKEVSKRGLFNPFKNESINESSNKLIPNVGTIDDFKLKSLLSKNQSVLDVLGNSEKSFMKRSEVDVIGVSGKNYDFIFTDGKQEFEIGGKERTLKHPLRKARPEIVKFYTIKESNTPKKGDFTYDYMDIGQFATPENKWDNFTDNQFEKIGKKIVDTKFKGDVGKAYDAIVHKKKNESINEENKRFYQQDGIGKAKYTISKHDGKTKNKDGSDFYDIKIFKNKQDLENYKQELFHNGYKENSGFRKESVNEDEKKVWKYKGVLLVDSDFVNFCKGKLPNSELKHAGGGDFFLQTPDGMISFDRTNGSLDGMSGRAHQVSDNQGGKLLALLIKKMGAKIVNES